MAVLRRLVAFLIVRAVVASAVGAIALYLTVGRERFRETRALLEGQRQVWETIARAIR